MNSSVRNKLIMLCNELDMVRKYDSIPFDSYVYGMLTSAYDNISHSICFLNAVIDDEQKVF